MIKAQLILKKEKYFYDFKFIWWIFDFCTLNTHILSTNAHLLDFYHYYNLSMQYYWTNAVLKISNMFNHAQDPLKIKR